MLILDEGTANIDPKREAAIRAMIRALPMTRIIVAHSGAMAEIADRVMRMEDGQLVVEGVGSLEPVTDGAVLLAHSEP